MKKNSRNWKILESLERREPSQVHDEFHQIFEQEPTHSIETICNAAVEEINNCLSPCPQPSFSKLTTTLENESLSVFGEPGPSLTKLLTLENVSLIDLNEDLYLSHSSNDGEPAPDECILSSLQDLCRQGIIPTQYHDFYKGFSVGTPTTDDEDN